MKTKYQILSGIAVLSIAGALCSCSEDYAADLAPETDVVRIASATVGAQSRAAVDANGFVNNDEFSLSTSADGTGAATYTLSDGKWDGTLYWSNEDKSDFYAAYPTTATYNSFTLPTDQSSDIEAANYMTAKQENVQRKAELHLTFSHKTAMVRIKIKEQRALANEGDLTNPVIRSPHSGYSEAAVTGNAVAVTPQTTTETGVEACYTSLIIPGNETSFKLFSVNVGGKEVSFTTNVDFEENHIYEYSLTIGKDRVALEALNVKNWETSNLSPGTMTKEWEGEEAEKFEGGSGKEGDPYQIANAAQLLMLANNVNTNDTEGKYYELTRDIDLAGANWPSIGAKTDYAFKGHFDGAGHSIKNMKINQSALTTEYEMSPCGLFYQLGDCSVRNLTIEDARIMIVNSANLSSIGVIAGQINTNACVIDNCHIKNATISYASSANDFSPFIGGIAGIVLGTVSISRCTVDNLTTPTALTKAYTGGILGQVDTGSVQIFASSVTNCELYGTYTGGLVGYFIAYNVTCKLEVSGSYADCTLNGTTKACIACGYDGSYAQPDFSASYCAGRGANALYTGKFKSTNVTELSNFTDPSEVYGIVANSTNPAAFNLDGTEYKVSECWKDNGDALPTLTVLEGEK